MKIGDLVKTHVATADAQAWWWNNKTGIITREAFPLRDGRKCWHVMIENRTANLSERSMYLITEAGLCDIYKEAFVDNIKLYIPGSR